MINVKKSLLRYFIFIFCVYSPQVFSAGSEVLRGTSDQGTQRDLTADQINQVKELLYNQSLKEYSVNLYGLLQGNFNFVDSIRNNTPDFNVSHARLGVFAVEKNWSGKLEVEFVGNQPQVLFPSVPENTPIYLAQSGNNTVTVRQAQINFDFLHLTSAAPGKTGIANQQGQPTQSILTEKPKAPKTEGVSTATTPAASEGTTSQPESTVPAENTAIANAQSPEKSVNTFVSRVSIGGIRVGGASATAPDAGNTPSGYSRQDGIYVTENMIFDKTDIFNLGFGVFNTLSTTNAGLYGTYQGWAAFPGTTTNFLGVLGVTSSTFSKAWLFNAGYTREFGDDRNIAVLGYYGFQNGAAVDTNQNGFATTVRNATHIEASIFYNDSKLFGEKALMTGNGFGFYFEQEVGSDQRNTGAAMPEMGAPPPDGYNHLLYGISVGGDTGNYFSSIFRDADRFLYAASMTFVDAKFDNKSYSDNYNLFQVAASAGYGYKSLETALVLAWTHSPQEPLTEFNYNSAVPDQFETDNQFKAYITAALIF